MTTRTPDAYPVPGSPVRTFGAVLRQLRAEYGLGTRRLADRSAVSRPAYVPFAALCSRCGRSGHDVRGCDT
jgi:hypothetical protein